MSSIKPDDGGGHVDGAEECGGPFIVSGGNASALREFGKEIFHPMSDFIHIFIVCTLHFAVRFWWDHPLPLGVFQQAQPTILRLIGFVGQQGVNLLQKAGQQCVRAGQIRRLSGREMKADGIAQRITGCMDFGRQSAFCAADACGGFLPPFAPAAC